MSKTEAPMQPQQPEPFLDYPSGGKYIMVRVEYAALTGDPLRALMLRVFEYEIDCKRRAWHQRADELVKRGKPRPKEPKRWWVSLSYQRLLWILRQLVKSKNTVIAHLDALLDKKLLLRRGDPFHGYEYTIDRVAMQKLFDALPAEALSLRFPTAENVAEDGENTVPNSGTPPTSDPYQILVQSVPEFGTPPTKDWYSSVPNSGTHRRSKKESQDPIKKDSAPSRLLSFPSLSLDISQLRSAPWESATIILLSSALLSVPDRAAIEAGGDGEAMAQYVTDWQKPAEKLLALTKDLDPARAWEHVERHIAGMLAGPTWYATKRARPSPITLRHVVQNWQVVDAELDRAGWWPEQRTPYDGPPISEYERGYGGVSQANDLPGPAGETMTEPLPTPVATPAVSIIDAVPPVIVEEMPPPPQEASPTVPSAPAQGMSEEDAGALMEQIWTEYPALSLALAQNTAGLFYVAVEEPPGGRWLHIKSWHAWLSPWPPRIEERIIAAAEYGGQRLAAMSSASDEAMMASMEGGD